MAASKKSRKSTTPAAGSERPEKFQFDFSTLTPKQLDVLGQISINNDSGHSSRTLKALERLKLIERYQESSYGPSPISQVLKITRWCMPVWVHIAWCEWCSQQHLRDVE